MRGAGKKGTAQGRGWELSQCGGRVDGGVCTTEAVKPN